MVREKGGDGKKKYKKLGDGNVYALLNFAQGDKKERELTRNEIEVIKLISCHKDYIDSHLARYLFMAEQDIYNSSYYSSYRKYAGSFNVCTQFKDEYCKLMKESLIKNDGEQLGILDMELSLLKELIDHPTYKITPEAYAFIVGGRIIENLATGCFVVWVDFAKQLYDMEVKGEDIKFDIEAFTKPVIDGFSKPINLFFNRRLVRGSAITDLLFKSFNMKKDFVKGLYFDKRLFALADYKAKVKDSTHKYDAYENIELIPDLNNMYLYETDIKISRELKLKLVDVPSILYSNNRSIKGLENKVAAKRYLEILAGAKRYDENGDLTGVGVFSKDDLSKIESGNIDKDIKLKLAINDSLVSLISVKDTLKKNETSYKKDTSYWAVRPEWSLVGYDMDWFTRLFEESADVKTLLNNGQFLEKFNLIYETLKKYGFRNENFETIKALT